MSRINGFVAITLILFSSSAFAAIEFSEASSIDNATVASTAVPLVLRQYRIASQREMVSSSFSGVNSVIGLRGFNIRRIARLASASRSSASGVGGGGAGGIRSGVGAVNLASLVPVNSPSSSPSPVTGVPGGSVSSNPSSSVNCTVAPASHAAPEPAALAIWGVLGAIGAVVGVRRRNRR